MVLSRNWLLIATILILLGLAVYLVIDLNRSGRREVVGQFKDLQTLLVRQVVHEADSYIKDCSKDLLTTADWLSTQHRGTELIQEKFLSFYRTGDRPRPLLMSIVDEKGTLLYASNANTAMTNYFDRELFTWAGKKSSRGRIVIEVSPFKPLEPVGRQSRGLFLMATPIYETRANPTGPGTTAVWSGVLIMIVDLESNLTQHLVGWSPSTSQRIWIMDEDGTILMQSEHPEMARENIHRISASCYRCHVSFDYAEAMLAARTAGTTEYQLRGQPKKLASYAPFHKANASWTVVINAPYAEVTAYSQKSFRKTLVLLGVMAAALILASMLVYQTNVSKVRAEEETKFWQDKHRLEEKLRRAEDRYRILFEQSPDGILMIDPQTTLPIEFSEAAHKQLGYSREELAQLRMHDYLADEARGEAEANLEKLQQEGQAHFETEHRTKTGEQRNVEVIAQTLELGERTVYHCIHHDITDRKRAEKALAHRTAQLEALYQVSLGITAELEPEVLFQTITRAAVTLFRGNTGGLFLHRSERDALELATQFGGPVNHLGTWVKRGEDLVGRVWQAGAPLVVADYPRWEGRSTLFEKCPCAAVMAAPIRWGDTFLGVLSISSNMAGFFTSESASLLELFATQAAIAIKNASLLEQVRRDATIKTTLLHDVNHRVKNNLMRLVQIVRLEQERAPLPETNLKIALMDLENRLHGMEVVHAMLSSAQWKPLPLSELVSQIVTAALNAAPNRQHIHLSVNAPPEPIWVVPELATAVALILNELTTNSVKYAFPNSPQGHIQVSFHVENETKGRPQVRLIYRDDGPGWPETVLRGKYQAVGLHLIQASVRSPLRGELVLRNDGGAIAELTFKLALSP